MNTATTKVCPVPECTAGGAPQDIATRFGYRTANGKQQAQSYCAECRKKKKQEKKTITAGGAAPVAETPLFQTSIPGLETTAPAEQFIDPHAYRVQEHLSPPIGAASEFEKAQYDAGHAFKVIEQFAKQRLGLFEHAITPKHAAVLIGLATGKSNRFADDETEGRFSLLLRSEASVHELPDFLNWVMPDWDSYSGYRYNRDNTGDVGCTAQRRIANALLRWGLALVAWCDEEQANREDIERKKKVREQKEKEKKAAAKAKAKAKGGKAGSRYVQPDEDDEDEEEE